jgi:hypothetical protein
MKIQRIHVTVGRIKPIDLANGRCGNKIELSLGHGYSFLTVQLVTETIMQYELQDQETIPAAFLKPSRVGA